PDEIAGNKKLSPEDAEGCRERGKLRTENLKLQKKDDLGQARPDVATATWSAALLAALETGLLPVKMRHG
ncbi:MAG: hypothetical protein QGH02_01400, partial [Verrucomicrobiota bacterium]|nr:hypothetical protein [Verrucomicrobiota bacterium]